MVTQAPRRSAIAIALAFVLSCIGLVVFVWTQFDGTLPFGPQGYLVKAVFPETGLLVPGADVRISGVDVGRVQSVSPRGVDSLVTMTLTPRYAPIPRDTRAILRQKTLLGEAFIMLSTGDRNVPKLADGGTLPRANVQPAQELDQVLDSFTPAVQHNLQDFLTGSGGALAGRGEDLNDAVGNFDPAVGELSTIVGVLNQQSGDVRSLVRNGGSVLQTLAARGAALRTLVTAGDQVLSATAGRNAQLTATVDALPPFLTELRTTLGTLNTTLGIARPSLAALAPVAPLLVPAFRGLNALSGPVVTLLRGAPPVLHDAAVALPDIRKFAVAFKPAVNALLPAAEQIAPVIQVVAEFRRELTAGMANLAAVQEASAPADTPSGSAKYLRALLTLGGDSTFGQSVRSPGDRSNAYFAPGEQSDIASGGKTSSSCSNTTNQAQFPVDDANVPCRLQPSFPWGHGIVRSYYPHVSAASPR